ncbi:snoRNA-binding rRNA-processing protein [Boothiomyces sp. JEL0838]|nr:snoRNA-binding rRNA-processing protein [Boothiomyces sp. JEL0838]
MPKDSKTTKSVRHDPLYVQLSKDASVERDVKPIKGKKKEKVPESTVVDAKTSKKILQMAKEQQNELAEENEAQTSHPKVFESIEEDDAEEEIDEEEYEDWDEGNELNIDAADQALIEKFMTNEPRQKLNLSEMIMNKISAAQANADSNESAKEPTINPKVVEVYTKYVGMLLSRYKSGKLPKTFKIIPTLRDWEEVLYITDPASWTPQAVYQATRIFTSNLKAKMAQRFFNIILLERVRNDIQDTKKLNVHLYMALKKSLYKPAAFFKGFLLPLLESGTCTLREAAIIGSVLIKISVPVLHSAAALLKIAEMDYTGLYDLISGPNSLFIRVLLDKKYALPFKVIDSLVFHFLRFKQDDRELPVLWHQSLLVFAQRYKEDMTPEQKEAILDLLKYKTHHEITAEVRRELQNSVCRGEMKPDPDMEIDF